MDEPYDGELTVQITNNTGMNVGYTMGTDPEGRECFVVVIKGTFNIPQDKGEKPELLESQCPIVEADTFHGEPGFSAPMFESEYAPMKRQCDVTLIGSAYAPDAKPVEKVLVGFKVGQISKAFHVLGERYWLSSANGYIPSTPQPFEKKTISYDIAFGGIDNFHDNESKHDPYMLNPVGIGYHKVLQDDLVLDSPAPSTEEYNIPITAPDRHYKPMSLGPIARSWLPRSQLGGTYDQKWRDDVFPFLPADFNNLYYQSAPEDQQTQYLQGGEEVVLLNVTQDGRRDFEIPKKHIPVIFFRKNAENEEKTAVLDTVVFDPENERFMCVWRTSVQLQNNPFEVPEALVGQASRAWWRARMLGKTYYAGLDALIDKKSDDEDDE